MISFREYIGIPFKYGGRTKEGIDCWGLVVIIYKEKLGVELFDMSGYEPTVESSSIFYKSISEFSRMWEKIDVDTNKLQTYDIILFGLDDEHKNIPTHIAVYTTFNKIIHCTEYMPVGITKLNRWIHKAHSAYRYIGEIN